MIDCLCALMCDLRITRGERLSHLMCESNVCRVDGLTKFCFFHGCGLDAPLSDRLLLHHYRPYRRCVIQYGYSNCFVRSDDGFFSIAPVGA